MAVERAWCHKLAPVVRAPRQKARYVFRTKYGQRICLHEYTVENMPLRMDSVRASTGEVC